VRRADAIVLALATFDHGGSADLYAGGLLTSAGGERDRALGRGELVGAGRALAVRDDGTGPVLFAGEAFGSAYDSRDSFLAKWGRKP
jgi:hypothetical protein